MKAIPQNLEAEEAVIGAILLDPAAFPAVVDLLRPEAFRFTPHRIIYGVAELLHQQGQPVDITRVSGWLADTGKLDTIGGRERLAELLEGCITAANVRDIAKLVADKHHRRQFIRICEQAAEQAADSTADLATLLGESARNLQAIAQQATPQGLDHLGRAVDPAVQRVRDRAEGRVPPGILTGFHDLDVMTQGLQRGDLFVLAARPAMGKAQPLNASIRTPTGWKTMGDLKVGDALQSVDGAPSFVSGIFPQGLKQVYSVTFSDGRVVECCEEHLWEVHHRKWPKSRVISTADVMQMLEVPSYKRRLWVQPVSGHTVEDQPLPLDPYVLGALLGDGCFMGSCVMISNPEPHITSLVSSRLGSGYELRFAGGCDWRIALSGGCNAKGISGVLPNPLKETLKTLGLWGKRSQCKFVPDCYLEASRSQRVELLRGLLDTDGWVESFGALRFSTASVELAVDVMGLVRSLGGTCTMRVKQTSYTYRGQRRRGLPAHMVNIQHPNAHEFVTLPAKRDRLMANTRKTRLSFAEIRPSRMAHAQCISVTHASRLYVTNGWVVTHNTSLGLNIAANVAQSLPVAVFTLEMSTEQLAYRLLSMQAGIGASALRSGRLGSDQWQRLTDVSPEVAALPIFANDRSVGSVPELRAQCERLAADVGGLGLVVIDYLQLLNDGKAGDNRVAELSRITRGLKALARDLSVPVLALSQLSRGVEARNNKRPMLSDLRESGSIEQDADIVAMIYRDDYYNPETTERGVAEVNVAKHRNGPVGTVKLLFQPEITRFRSMAATYGGSSLE